MRLDHARALDRYRAVRTRMAVFCNNQLIITVSRFTIIPVSGRTRRTPRKEEATRTSETERCRWAHVGTGRLCNPQRIVSCVVLTKPTRIFVFDRGSAPGLAAFREGPARFLLVNLGQATKS